MVADVDAEVRHLLVELGLGLAAVLLRFRLQLPELRLGVVGRQQHARYAALRGTGGLVSGGGDVGVGVGVKNGAVVAIAVLLVRVLAPLLEHDVGIARARAGVTVDCRGAPYLLQHDSR